VRQQRLALSNDNAHSSRYILPLETVPEGRQQQETG